MGRWRAEPGRLLHAITFEIEVFGIRHLHLCVI